MQHEHAAVAHWDGGPDERGLQVWAENLRSSLRAPVSLGLVFLSPQLFPQAVQILEVLRVHAHIPLLAGCSSRSLIQGGTEIENSGGLVLGLFSLPGASLEGVRFTTADAGVPVSTPFRAATVPGGAGRTNAWLVFADPFHLDIEDWLREWNHAHPSQPMFGGLASGDPGQPSTQVYLNGEVFTDGGVAISVGGGVRIEGVLSQGCTPIGETWTITRAEGTFIHEIGNRPAYEVLAETFNQLSPSDQRRTQGNLFVGLVVNEYREEFHRGDFLVRNLLGVDPRSGSIAVGALPRAGQTLQFQRRDAEAASADLTDLLSRARSRLHGAALLGGCLCSCNGRGRHLFGRPDHDAGTIQQMLGPLGLAGFFCNGELGPVGDRNFVHGYTASLALFVPA